MTPENIKKCRADAELKRISSGLFKQRIEAIKQRQAKCHGCQYEIEHEGKKVCRTMTRTHGQPCDAFKEREE